MELCGEITARLPVGGEISDIYPCGSTHATLSYLSKHCSRSLKILADFEVWVKCTWIVKERPFND